MKYIIFDFNGTILDDVDVNIECINQIAKKYLNREPVKKEEYLNIFDFPVIDYYKKVGFDFEKLSFKVVGREWMDLYESKSQEYRLMEGIEEILQNNIDKGYKNIILSASMKENLDRQCHELGIYDYFDEILGIDNIYAGSKEHIAKAWIEGKDPSECIFIGDTRHDLDVARAIGVRCALVAKGHQSKAKLLEYTNEVYDDIREVNYD